MNFRPWHYVALSQIILGLCIAACIIIIPHYLFTSNQGGVSNYGTENSTSLLFILGFATVAVGTFVAAIKIPVALVPLRLMRPCLFTISALYGLVLISTIPYKINNAYESLHLFTAFTLFIAIIFFVFYVRFSLIRDKKIECAFIMFCVGLFGGLLTMFEILAILFTGQLICGISFGYILARTLKISVNNTQQ